MAGKMRGCSIPVILSLTDRHADGAHPRAIGVLWGGVVWAASRVLDWRGGYVSGSEINFVFA